MKNYWSDEKLEFLRETSNLLTGEAYKLFCERFLDATSYTAFAVKRSKLNCCKAEVKKLKWRPEWLQFIKDTKGLERTEAYKLFIKNFPDADTTEVAFYNQRSRSGASPKKPHGSNRRKPLYAESRSKKYCMIKIAEPDVWISKARWIYEETHPGELTEPGDEFHFLNSNREDFSPANIIKVKQKERTAFLQTGGADTNPEITKSRLLQARLKIAELDLGEKIGMVVQTSAGRKWKK